MDVDGLLEEVSAAVALDDYGDPTFRDGLDVLWASGTKEADLNEIGMMALEAQVRMYLANRLRVREWHRTHPGLATTPVAAPLILVGHAPHRHHRVEPPARGRSRQPLAARLGGERVGAAAEPLDLPRRPALRRRPRRAQRRPPDQPRVQGDPPRRARRRDGVHRRCTRSTSRASSTRPRSTCRATTNGCSRPTGAAPPLPPPRVAGAAVGVPGALAAEVAAVRVAARRAARDLSRRAAGRHPS